MVRTAWSKNFWFPSMQSTGGTDADHRRGHVPRLSTSRGSLLPPFFLMIPDPALFQMQILIMSWSNHSFILPSLFQRPLTSSWNDPCLFANSTQSFSSCCRIAVTTCTYFSWARRLTSDLGSWRKQWPKCHWLLDYHIPQLIHHRKLTVPLQTPGVLSHLRKASGVALLQYIVQTLVRMKLP